MSKAAPVRTALEIATSVAMSVALASLTLVPLALAMFEPPADEEMPAAYAGIDEDGPDEGWIAIPTAPTVAVLASEPASEPEAASEPVAPSVADVKPTVVSALPLVEGGVDVPIADPLAFLETGWGAEPDPTVDDPDDGAPDDPSADGDDNDGLADASPARGGKIGRAKARPKPGKKAPKPACTEDIPGVVEIEPGHWVIQRSLVEYYATHLLEFEKLATYVVTHKNEADEPDGFKVGLRRCGLLWESGFRSGDVVNSVNERTISTVMQAVRAYFALNDESEFEVGVTRKGGQQLLLRYTLLDDTKEDKDLVREFLREARRIQREEADARRAEKDAKEAAEKAAEREEKRERRGR